MVRLPCIDMVMLRLFLISYQIPFKQIVLFLSVITNETTHCKAQVQRKRTSGPQPTTEKERIEVLIGVRTSTGFAG